MTRTVVALYENYETANSAVQDLIDSGFKRDDISYMAGDESGEYARRMGIQRTNQGGQGTAATDVHEGSNAGVGAGVGAAVGGVSGILLGLGAMLIPGIGPVVAAGPLAAVLAGVVGAGAGAVVGGVIGALTDMGVPEETAGYYAEGIRRGGTLLTVRTDDYMSDRAVEVLNRHHPINLKERVGEWRQSGWTGLHTEQPVESNQQRMRDQQMDRQIPDTGAGQQGPYGTGSGMGPAVTGPGTMGMGSTEQGTYGGGRDVYGTQSDREERLRDEGRSQGPMGQDYSGQHARGERLSASDMQPREIEPGGDTLGGGGAIGSEYENVGMERDYGDYSIYEARFRNDFMRSPFSRDYTYEEYAPAYHYGYDLAHMDQYHGQRWEAIEPNIQRDWERDHPNTWDRFKDSIRNAWEDVKDALD
jgi:hypothetical protein